MREIIIQSFSVKDLDDDGIVDEILVNFQKLDGGMITKTIELSGLNLMFFQKIFDIIKNEI